MALDLNDKTANGNTLTNSGAAEVTSSLAFTGSAIAADLEASESDYLYAADSASLSITGNLTIELLVKFESVPSGGNTAIFVAKAQDDGVNEISYFFMYTEGTGLRFIISPDGSYNILNDVSTAWSPSTDTWYHIAVTFATSTKTAKFYVDGSQTGTDKTTNDGTIFNNARRLSIGAERTDTTARGFLDGVVDEVRIWNTTRTQTEINDNKLKELTGSEAGLAAYWPFEVLFVPKIIVI